MPDKTIYLYDRSNKALCVKGIRVELYDAVTSSYLDGKDSDDLSPGSTPATWGVVLTFPSGTSPVDILIRDPSYKYPGNTLRFLNGDLADDVYMDLLCLPSGPGGQPPAAAPLTVPGINSWVDAAAWNPEEKGAVRNLIFQYAQIIAPEQKHLPDLCDLAEVAANWSAALRRVGFSPELLNEIKP